MVVYEDTPLHYRGVVYADMVLCYSRGLWRRAFITVVVYGEKADVIMSYFIRKLFQVEIPASKE